MKKYSVHEDPPGTFVIRTDTGKQLGYKFAWRGNAEATAADLNAILNSKREEPS